MLLDLSEGVAGQRLHDVVDPRPLVGSQPIVEEAAQRLLIEQVVEPAGRPARGAPGTIVELDVGGHDLTPLPVGRSHDRGVADAGVEPQGALDPDGYLRLVGRAKELIISGGYNVYPREVEDALRLHPGILDAAVVGSPDRQWGEVVTAYVELDHGAGRAAGGPTGGLGDVLDQEALRRFLDDRLAAYKRPRIVHVVEALPRNALGKVQKHLLAGS